MDPNGNSFYRNAPPNGGPMNGRPISPRVPVNASDQAAVPEPLRPSVAASRAEKYEDEKRRISSTCFQKVDDSGIPLQSYITHIRVEEDSMYQSAPPPPDHPPQHKKPRVIVVAVKSNGRVTMHKARENEDGSFQIGKSWPMDELQSIETFAGSVPRSAEDETRARWAGPTGFIITMGKPYYWQAKTAKEKDFFIGSLVKIYNKYTEGKVPDLIGFEPRERDQVLGTTRPPQAFLSSTSQGGTPTQEKPAAVQSASSRVASPAAQRTAQPAAQPLTQSSVLQPPSRPFASDSRPGSSSSAGPEVRSLSTASSDGGRTAVVGPRAFPQPGQSPARTPTPNQQPPRSRAGTPQLNSRPSQDRIGRPPPTQEQFRPSPVQSPPPGSSSRLTPSGARPSASEDPQPPILSPRRQAERSRSGLGERAASSTRGATPEAQAFEGGPSDRRRAMNEASRERTRDRSRGPSSEPSAAPTESASSRSVFPQPRGPTSPPTNGATYDQSIPERRRPPMKGSPIGADQQTSQLPLESSSSKAVNSQRLRTGPSIANDRSATSSISHISANDSSDPTPPVQSPGAETETRINDSRDQNVELPATTQGDGIIAKETVPEAKEISPVSPLESEAEDHRPGLGPMLNKKVEVANKLRKAVNAHTAFKPRAGGAGERLLAAKTKTSNEPDGITGVVPAKSPARMNSVNGVKSLIDTAQPTEKNVAPSTLDIPQAPLAVEITSPSPVLGTAVNSTEEVQGREITPIAGAEVLRKPRHRRPSRSPSRQREKRQNPFAGALPAVDIDPYIFGGRELEYEDILGEFGWSRQFLQSRKIEALETDLRREIGRLEAGSWLGHSEEKDERVEVVEKLLDKTIAECDEMEGLLTLYSVELSTLTEDIAYIEAQSQGLQVQTANQKLLHTELQNLVQTISLDTEHMESLTSASLSDNRGLESIEESLLLLYKALSAIDPASISTDSATGRAPRGSEMSGMRALQERKDSYKRETGTFLHRTRQYMDPAFGAAFQRTKDALAGTNAASRDGPKLHDLARNELWRYGPLMLFAKEVNRSAWEDLLRAYQPKAREVYQDEMRDSTAEWKRRVRKMTSDEHDTLFTAQEKESEGLTSTARKLTVKRSQTLARGLRQASAEKKNALNQNRDGNQYPFEAFTGALNDMLPLISTEQNFVVDFFHATTLEDLDFQDAVAAAPPSSRHGTDLFTKRPLEPDRAMAKRVNEAVAQIFPSWPSDVQALIDWAVKDDQFQGVGVIFALERALQEYTDSSQEYILRTLTGLHNKLAGLFTRFVDDQVRAIEATKVKIKKRKGVLGFIRVFPNFSAVVENMLLAPNELVPSGGKDLEIRRNIDQAYERINKAMFNCLRQIAKEVPSSLSTAPAPVSAVIGASAAADPEDKEALNQEILLIENMFHYYTEVDERASPVLGAWRAKAALELEQHQDRYVSAVIRRPLGRLLDFVEGLDAHGASAPEHPTHSRSAFRKLLSAHDPREMRRGIDALRKRVEKHFGESGGEDVALNQRLVAQILGECERRYVAAVERVEAARVDVYGGEGEFEFGKADVAQGFRR